MSTMIDHDEKPEYCLVEKIIIEEGAGMNEFGCLQRYCSELLWHFTGYAKSENASFETLKKILSDKVLKWHAPKFSIAQDPPSPPLELGCISLCDIPFKDLHLHSKKYGDFAIAFNKTAAIKMGAFNPVLYVQKDHELTKYLKAIFPHIAILTNDKENGRLLEDFLKFILAHFKPSDLTKPPTMTNEPDDNWEAPSNYYFEREWRSITHWNFNYSDIELVLVKEKYKKPAKDFLRAIGADLDILSSEMISKL